MLNLFHTLYFEATRNCNLACPYCSTKSSYKIKYPELDTKTIVNRIFEPAWDLGTKQIDFSGGEFLLRKDAFNLLKIANEIGFKSSIVSNGTTLNRNNLDKLKKILGDNFFISLGVNEFSKKNSKTRDYDINKFLKLLKTIEEYSISVNLCVTVGKFNVNSFSDTVKQIDKLGYAYNRIPFSPRNSYCTDLMFDKELMQKKIHPVLRKYFKGYVSYTPLFLPPHEYFKITDSTQNHNLVPTNPSIGCWVGSFYGINPEGEVAPCPLLLDHISGGNVLKQDLKSILFESDLFHKIIRRENLKGKCGTCKYNYTCGGCRTLSYYYTGDVFEEDPTCFIDNLSESEISDIEAETTKNFKNFHRMIKMSNFL